MYFVDLFVLFGLILKTTIQIQLSHIISKMNDENSAVWILVRFRGFSWVNPWRAKIPVPSSSTIPPSELWQLQACRRRASASASQGRAGRSLSLSLSLSGATSVGANARFAQEGSGKSGAPTLSLLPRAKGSGRTPRPEGSYRVNSYYAKRPYGCGFA